MAVSTRSQSARGRGLRGGRGRGRGRFDKATEAVLREEIADGELTIVRQLKVNLQFLVHRPHYVLRNDFMTVKPLLYAKYSHYISVARVILQV